MQAVILAAGTGSRLGKYTANVPKCMVQVGERTIIERALSILEDLGVDETIIVTGYKRDILENFVTSLNLKLRIRFIYNQEFATTNNIVSLGLASSAISSDFFLIESDVVFSAEMLRGLRPGTTACLSPFQPWMNGTVVTLESNGFVSAMYLGKDPKPVEPLYKTVNLYYFDFSTWKSLRQSLDHSIRSGNTGVYYETIFATAIREKTLTLRGYVCPDTIWHEIDTPADLSEAQMKAR